MKMPNKEEQRQIIRQWKETGRILEELRYRKLRGMSCDLREIEAALQLAEHARPRPDNGMGMVEMQRKFMLIREKMKQRDA